MGSSSEIHIKVTSHKTELAVHIHIKRRRLFIYFNVYIIAVSVLWNDTLMWIPDEDPMRDRNV
jgi:hypothetical protein